MGNNLRPGKSIIIFLLNKQMDKVHSVEQIFLGEEYRFRHFVTDSKNSLYEDEDGSIYVSADQKGIYKMKLWNIYFNYIFEDRLEIQVEPTIVCGLLGEKRLRRDDLNALTAGVGEK